MTATGTEDRVGATRFTTPSDRELVATRTFDAPRSLLWRMWTEPQHVQKWMLGPDGWTMPLCEIDLRPGGKWRWGWSQVGTADGEPQMVMSGEYREVTPPERLVWTERWGADWPETLTTLVLTESGGRTTATCTVVYPSPDALGKALATDMKDGWSQSYDRLDTYLNTLA